MRTWRSCGLLAGLLAAGGIESRAAGPNPVVAQGKELFLREWRPNDGRAHGGDGLGPVYNERSCVACHKQGGVGGSGPDENNVSIVTATKRSKEEFEPGERDVLKQIHVGFRDSPSVVFHRSGTDPTHAAWLGLWEGLLKPVSFANRRGTSIQLEQGISLGLTQRNTPALFGVGRIDAITEEALEAAATRTHKGFHGVRGRVSRLPDGRIGRFGWKAQTATLEDFVLTACAGEIGLEVPDHHQSQPPRPADPPAGLDMTEAECDALVAYVRRLPVPVVGGSAHAPGSDAVAAGADLFRPVGCAACHAQKLGHVEGIYSDLLLHDMGPGLTDSGVYYGESAPSTGELAKAQEWRTPPLWGVGDSAPYLHDGRAKTLDDAIRGHGGEAQESVDRYTRRLKPIQRDKLLAFLGNLAAPGPLPRGTVRAVSYAPWTGGGPPPRRN